MFEQFLTAIATARTSGARVAAQARLENAACAARLATMYVMLEHAHAASGSAEREQWRFDNWAAVCDMIGATQTVTSGIASGLLMNAVALAERLPKVAAVFAEGLISHLLVRAICTRTALVKDPDALRALDAELAAALRCWGARSVDQAHRDIDALVVRHDPYAVRRTEEVVRTTGVRVYTDKGCGVAYLDATVDATDGAALDQRVDLLARTVCDGDPRTMEQRRAAAVGAMGFGWDRLPCLCEQADCAAASVLPVGVVVVLADTVARDEAPPPPEDPGPEPDDEASPDSGDDTRESGDDAPVEGGCDETATDADGPLDAPTVGDESDPGPDTPEPAWVGDLEAQRRALVGDFPPLLSKPLRDYTLAELIAELNAVIAQLAMYATIRPLIHPGQSPPEPRYRPSRRLADFVRARDLTCRHPGCSRPATRCQIDHVIPYPYGPTAASNLACLCVQHHLLKTFWPGWSYTLDPDGTAHWTDPDGHVTTSHPGSRLIFPELCTPTATFAAEQPPAMHAAGLTMPTRNITRKQARERRIDDERQANIGWAEQYLRDGVPPF